MDDEELEEEEGEEEDDDDEDDDEEEEGEEEDEEVQLGDNENINEVNHENDYISHSYEKRSANSYINSLQKKGKARHHQGVKFNSIFNQLKGFHVCNPGLPPCLAHDLLEGIVPYDVFLMMKHFVSRGRIDYAFVNLKIFNGHNL